MATGAAWLNRKRLTGRRKRKCALTSTGLLMEGLGRRERAKKRATHQPDIQIGNSGQNQNMFEKGQSHIYAFSRISFE
jgi:hypothetical protein